MTSPHDLPLSRRAARRALEAENAGAESFAQPNTEGAARSKNSSGTPSSVPSSAPTDMTYRTQVRPRVPHYDERSTPVAPVIERPSEVPQSPPPVAPSAMPEHGAERVRRRDFRPPAATDGAASQVEPATFDAPLEYHTQLTSRSTPAPAASTPAPPPAHVIDAGFAANERIADPSTEQTLSRRELRELRAAQWATAAPAPLVEQEPAEVAPSDATPVNVEPPRIESGELAPILIEPVAVEPELAHPVAVEHIPVVPTTTGSHWSTGIHDDEDPFENTFSREVGSATSLNTNALVLPEMPSGSIAGPVTGTGEIIVTGMITVSPLHSATGTVPTLHDSPDIDDFFDAEDREVVAPDSAPVSALKAISSHTSSHTVMTGKPSTSNTITTVLVASTVGMAVVAIGLFVVAAANGLF